MTTAPPRRRARPLSAEQRREKLVDATLELLRRHGSSVTTRQIAAAAGVAEGTIFRVFATKDDLVDAAIAQAFATGDLERRILEIDADLPLRDRLLQLVGVLQQRFRATFDLMGRLGLVRPPQHLHDSAAATLWRERFQQHLEAVVGADTDRLGVPVEEFVHTLRLLTFSGSHPQIAEGRILTPPQIVDTVLRGLLRTEERTT